MKIIRASVDNATVVVAFWIGVVALSAWALWTRVPTRLMPYVQSPQLAVVTTVMGMPADRMETAVTDPIEKQLSSLHGYRSIRSSSMNGMSIITVEYPYRWDMQRARTEVQGCLLSVSARLGLQAGQQPQVLAMDPLNLPVVRLALRASDRGLDELRTFADNVVVPRLQAVAGVGSVYAFGGDKPHVDIALDRERLAALGLSLLDVRHVLEEAAHVPQALGWGDTWLARCHGHDFFLRDVATVEGDSYRRAHAGGAHHHARTATDSAYRLNGQDAVEINVAARVEASSPVVVAAVRQAVDDLRRQHPAVSMQEAFDGSHYVDALERDVVVDLVAAVAITALVVYLFLWDVRGTLIALITIPASLACALLGFVPLGLSLNSSSLVGLMLAIGRLVDDTIVDLNAVHQHLRLGKSARDAAMDGCSEVRRAVISATLILCLALLPLTLCGGLTQDMFVGIVWPLMLSLLASLLVALTLTPVLAAIAYGNLQEPPRQRPFLQSAEQAYGRILDWALQRRALVVCLAVAFCYLAAALYPFIGSEMMPMADVGQAYGVVEASGGASAQETMRIVTQVEQLLLQRPEVLAVSTEVGSEAGQSDITGYDVGDATTARMMITLTDRRGREPIWKVLDSVSSTALRTIPELRRLTLKEMGSDVMASAMAPIELVVYGPNLDRLSWLAEETVRLARYNPQLIGAVTAWALDREQWRVEVRPAAAAALGLSTQAVMDQAQSALGSSIYGKPPVMLHYREDQRRRLQDLARTVIVGRDGRRAPLSAVAKLEPGRVASMIMHDNLRRVNSVMAYYRPGGVGSMSLAMDWMMQSAMSLPFPPGYGLEQRGDMAEMMDAFGRLLRGLGMALGLIYLALAVQFRSILLPLALMAAIPLELCGVFGALLLAHQTFSTVSLLGIVVLNGMDVTAAILLVDRMLQLRGQERAVEVRPAGRMRLCPIMMTVIVTLAVMMPLALFPRGGLEAYAPLATVVMGGLLVSTPLTLLVIPVLYTLLDDLRRRVA